MINEEENDLLGSVQLSFSFLSRQLLCALRNKTHRSPDGYKATEILAAINKLGINDDNKSKIVASGALASYVSLLAGSCSSDEQFLSAQGLWTLAMKCPDDVRSQRNCVAGERVCVCGLWLYFSYSGVACVHLYVTSRLG